MKTLAEFKNFIEEVTANNSRNYKLDVLRKYQNNDSIKFYLNYIYNPYIVTGISDKKVEKIKSLTPDHRIVLDTATVQEMLKYISIYNTGAENYLETMKDFLDRILPEELHELFFKIISKNIQLGLDSKSINKIIPNLIPTFNVQLANKYFDNPTIVEGKQFALTTKIDGGRIIAIKKNGEAKFYTRQGQEYEGLVDLKKEMEEYLPDNICLDGEITLLSPYVESSIPDFIENNLWEDDTPRISTCTKLSSKEQYKQTMMITRRDGEKHGVKMLVFDCMTADQFENQRCDTKYLDRRKNLENIFFNHNYMVEAEDYEYKYFELLPILYIGDDTTQITEWLNKNIANGEEGVMINMCDAPYDFKRTNNLLKVKKMNDLDLEVVGFEEGTNSNAGRLGALLVNYKDNIVKVGSGFSQELREEIWNHKEEWLGRTIVVQYFEETTNQNGGISLRFPVYVDYRTDK